MERIFELVGMAVTLVAVVIGFRAMMSAARPKPRKTRLRVQPIAATAPSAHPQRRRRPRRHATDPLEEVVGLLVQLPIYLYSVGQAAYQTARELRADYVMARPALSKEPAAEAAETLRNVSETPETPPETPAADAASDITTAERAVDAASPTVDAEAESIRLIAQLLKAQVIKSETRALEVAFKVNAGGGKDYQRLKGLLKDALADLEPKEQTVALTHQVPVVSGPLAKAA